MLGRRAAALLVLLLPVLLAAGLGVGAGWAASRLIRVPKVEQLASYRPDIVTEIRGADGSIVARFAIERRFLVTRDQLPEVLVQAVLAAEDARFYDHGGVDIIRIGGAALRDLATRRLAEGASTITQQLARSVFLTPQKSFARKLNEVFLTVEIEKFEQEGGLRRIFAAIIVDRSAHRIIIIGKEGERLKRISTDARKDMEKLFGGKVWLETWIKVKTGWADDERALKSLGYE